MGDDLSSESLLVRYLLGDLPESKQIEIEDRAFEDHHYLHNLQAIESDLIDDYVRGGLSRNERRQFEGRFLSSAERRRKVEFARALASVTPEFAVVEREPRPAIATPHVTWRRVLAAFVGGLSPAGRYALAAAALLIVLAGSWLITESFRLRGQIAELRAEQLARERRQQVLEQQIADEQARSADASAQLERERQQRERDEQLVGTLQSELQSATQSLPSAAVSLILSPGLSRGGGARPKLALDRSSRLVRVQVGIEPGDEYQGFRVELRGPDGRLAWSQEGLHARPARAGRGLTLTLPAKLLTAGQYELALKGAAAGGKIDDIGYYYFDVLKK